jgi:hypothetical protein
VFNFIIRWYHTAREFFRFKLPEFIQYKTKGYANTDWYSAYSVLSKRMLPVIKMYKDKAKHGIPSVLFENEKQHLLALGYEYNKDGYYFTEKIIDGKTASDIVTANWQYIIDEIYFALNYCAYEDDSDCYVENPKYNPKQKEFMNLEKVEDGSGSRINFNEDYGKTKLDFELLKIKVARVNKGLELMGCYWMSLWD